MVAMFVEAREEDEDVIGVAVVPPDTSLGTGYQDTTLVLAREVQADVDSVYEVRDGKRCLLLPITWPILKNLTDPARNDATPPPEGHFYAVVMGDGVAAIPVRLPSVARAMDLPPRSTGSPFPQGRRRVPQAV
ncbi:MAG TPA: hypothetical protein VGR62_20570 [Candidatus Binatia bacterium]|jgi:hypothetical protein|nr:hypothetical protein [Candidatus Binatia bacterium]